LGISQNRRVASRQTPYFFQRQKSKQIGFLLRRALLLRGVIVFITGTARDISEQSLMLLPVLTATLLWWMTTSFTPLNLKGQSPFGDCYCKPAQETTAMRIFADRTIY
jgi:hypothetical protein